MITTCHSTRWHILITVYTVQSSKLVFLHTFRHASAATSPTFMWSSTQQAVGAVWDHRETRKHTTITLQRAEQSTHTGTGIQHTIYARISVRQLQDTLLFSRIMNPKHWQQLIHFRFSLRLRSVVSSGMWRHLTWEVGDNISGTCK